MRCLSVLVLGLCAFPAFAAEPKVEWTKTTTEKGGFEVRFPGKATDNTKEGMVQYVLEVLDGKAAHLATSTALPAPIDITDKNVVKKMFDGGKDGLVKGFKGSKVLAERNLVFAGKYPSKEVDLEIPTLGVYRTKWIVTPTAFIQMVVLGPQEYVEGATASLFMDSLKLLDANDKK